MKYLLQDQETERIKFRSIQQSDYPAWLEFFKHPNSHLNWKGDFEDPITECNKWYKNQQRRYENDLGGMNALVEKKTGLLLGHCGLLIQTVDNLTKLEIGYSILPQYWNRGIASEAAQKCRDFAFENNFSDHLISIISFSNTPSQKVAKKNGMSIHKSTVYSDNDVYIFRISKTEWFNFK